MALGGAGAFIAIRSIKMLSNSLLLQRNISPDDQLYSPNCAGTIVGVLVASVVGAVSYGQMYKAASSEFPTRPIATHTQELHMLGHMDLCSIPASKICDNRPTPQ